MKEESALQTTALKDQIRQLSESKDADISQAVAPLDKRIQELTANTTRVESMARLARAGMGKSQAECQVKARHRLLCSLMHGG